jgi:hypothetical protein
MTGFYTPDWPEIAQINKWGSAQGMDENFRKGLVSDFLFDSEIVHLSKVFGSRNQILMFQNCDIGWLFVTNKRILFWSDESKKPHAAIDFENITQCSSRWAIMKMRSVKIKVEGVPVKFGTHRNAARLIEKIFKDFNKIDN